MADIAAQLIQFEQRLRQAEDRVALRFVIVNEIQSVIDCDQAYLATGYAQKFFAVMGATNVAKIERTAPMIQALDQIVKHVLPVSSTAPVKVGETKDLSDSLVKEFRMPGFYAWIPLHQPGLEGKPEGGVFLTRQRAFTQTEVKLLEYIGSVITHSIAAIRGRMHKLYVPTVRKVQSVGTAIAFVVFLLGFLPVHLESVAPAEIIPINPFAVTAPLNGTIQKVHVEPNTEVVTGDLLYTFDDIEQRQSLNVAQSDLALAEAELSQAQKLGFVDAEARRELLRLQTAVNSAQAKVDLAQIRLDKTKVFAPFAGQVLIDNPSSLSGRPVQPGDLVMQLVDADARQLEVRVAMTNIVAFKQGSQVTFYPDQSPLTGYMGAVKYTNITTEQFPDGSIGYRVTASLEGDVQHIAFGAQGTASIKGPKSSLWYRIFRKLFIVLRQKFG